jgi:hypothetical protein
MADDNRVRRPEPERTGPNRSFAGVFKNDPWAERDDFWHRRNGSSSPHGQESDNTRAQSFDDRASFESAAASFSNVAQEAVDLAYKISEPYLRAGLRAAEAYTARESGTRNNFDAPFQGGEAMNQPYGDPMTQMYGQLARAYAEFMVSLARAAYGAWYPPSPPYGAYPRRRGWCGPSDGCYEGPESCPPPPRWNCATPPPPSYCAPQPSYGSTPPHAAHRGQRIEIKVVDVPATRWVTISKQLYHYSESPRLKWLRHTEIDNAKLDCDEVASNGTVTVNVKVAPNEPIGTYTGPITDDQTHHIVGIVTVQVSERTA